MQDKFLKIYNMKYFDCAAVGLLCAIVFLTIYGSRVLNPTYVDWLMAGGDLSQHYLGWRAFREGAWQFPIGMTDVLAYPTSTSVIFTDSIPLLAVPFKLLSALLPENFQYFGWWGLGCFVAQGVLAARIIGRFAPNKAVTILMATLFAYTPVMIYRMYGHTALAGQWILLLAMQPVFSRIADMRYCGAESVSAEGNYARAAQKRWRLPVRFAIIGALAASIHMYFVLMCGIILVGVCLLELLHERTWRAVGHTACTLVVFLASAVFVTFLLGGFAGDVNAEAGGLGTYSFNLNGFFNPQSWSCIYKNLYLYGKGQYEGIAYLGAGVIMLCTFAIVVFFASGRVREITRKYWKAALALFACFAIAMIAALSPVVTINAKVVFTYSVPGFIEHIWNIFRASGRIIWIDVYMIELVACVILCRLANKRTCTVVAALVLALQIYDMRVTLGQKHDHFCNEQTYTSELETTAFWDSITQTGRIKHIVYYSSLAQSTMYSLTDFALDNGMTTNTFYFARVAQTAITAAKEAALAELPGDYMFIFLPDDKSACINYDLHYYEADGLIVGLPFELPDYTELTPEFFEELKQ